MIKEVTKFQTEDGKFFDNLEEAKAHEDKRNLEIKLASFVEKHFCSGLSVDNIYDTLLEEKDELLKILTNKKI
jgi:hypothetical protein